MSLLGQLLVERAAAPGLARLSHRTVHAGCRQASRHERHGRPGRSPTSAAVGDQGRRARSSIKSTVGLAPEGCCVEGEPGRRAWVKLVSKCVLQASLLIAIRCTFPVAAAACEVAAAGPAFLAPLKGMVDFILHLDHHLGAIIAKHGATTYAILFAIVFCETGLVLTPFLPGDSLLFACGAFAGLKKLNILYLLATFITSAILGDAVNYAIGSWLGERAIESNLVSKKAITKTENFYDKYGGKTIVLARFVPIVRTFAPFVAGISSMTYEKFAAYNVLGAIVWTLLFTGVGFFFGNLPFVEKNFSVVVLAIVVVSILPVIYEIWAARREDAEGRQDGKAAPT